MAKDFICTNNAKMEFKTDEAHAVSGEIYLTSFSLPEAFKPTLEMTDSSNDATEREYGKACRPGQENAVNVSGFIDRGTAKLTAAAVDEGSRIYDVAFYITDESSKEIAFSCDQMFVHSLIPGELQVLDAVFQTWNMILYAEAPIIEVSGDELSGNIGGIMSAAE
jgi:hypothetical protein